jgi:hypothetical protein
VLILEGKAAIVETVPDRVFRSVREEFPVPATVALKEYHHTGSNFYQPATLNQSNLMLRDGYRCAYCRRHAVDLKPSEYLTRDHVVPQSRGGGDVWTNCVTSCSTCNHKKDDCALVKFIKVLDVDIIAAEEQLARTTNTKQQVVVGERLARLQTMRESARGLQVRGPKQPRVFEILSKRAQKRSWRDT